MKEYMPVAYSELVENCKILELHYKDMMVRSMPQSSLNCPEFFLLNIQSGR